MLKLDQNYSKLKPDSDFNYKEMIASYIIYVNLLNTFCGVRMSTKWNETIKNLYVYKKVSQNDVNNVFSEMEIEKGIKEMENTLMLEHALKHTRKTDLKYHLNMVDITGKFFGVLIYLLNFHKSYPRLTRIAGVCILNEYIIGIDFNLLDNLKIFADAKILKIILANSRGIIKRVNPHDSIDTFTSVRSILKSTYNEFYDKISKDFAVQNQKSFSLYEIYPDINTLLSGGDGLAIEKKKSLEARLQYFLDIDRTNEPLLSIKSESPDSQLFSLFEKDKDGSGSSSSSRKMEKLWEEMKNIERATIPTMINPQQPTHSYDESPSQQDPQPAIPTDLSSDKEQRRVLLIEDECKLVEIKNRIVSPSIPGEIGDSKKIGNIEFRVANDEEWWLVIPANADDEEGKRYAEYVELCKQKKRETASFDVYMKYFDLM